MSIRPNTLKLFREWHDNEPHKVITVQADWAPYYTKTGIAAALTYYSVKWKETGDQGSSTYVHEFEGAPCYVWAACEAHHEGATRLSLPDDVAVLGEALELELDDQSVFHWRRGQARLVAPDASRVAIVTRARYVPLILTNTRVTPDGIDDK